MKKKAISACVSLIFLGVFLFISDISFAKENTKDLGVFYLDVGQGDSSLIEAPNGLQVLIDAGKDEKVLSELDKILPFYDRKIDIAILSHGDMDHIGGFFEILDRYEIGEIIRSNTKIDSQYENNLLEKAKQKGVEIRELGIGDKIVLDQSNNIYLEVYWPKKGSVDSNENSLVLELIHGENEFLFTGDSTVETEMKIIGEFDNKVDSDVLKVAHHGSKTSTSQIFLEKVSPDFSVLSYGENSYGHPHQEVIDRLNKTGGEILQTKERATIVARSDGKNLELNYLYKIQNNFLRKIFQNLKNMSLLIQS